MTQKRRPGYLTAYAKHAGISKPAAAEQLKRVGIDYMQSFDFTEADKRREAARHADRAAFAKPIYVEPGESPRDPDDPAVPVDQEGVFSYHQTEKEKFKAKLAELDYLERIGKLVEREKVEAEAFRLAQLVRDAMLNITARVEGMLATAMTVQDVRKILDPEIRQALESLTMDDDTGGTAAA